MVLTRVVLVRAITASLVVASYSLVPSAGHAVPANSTSSTFALGSLTDCVVTATHDARCWGYIDDGQDTSPSGLAGHAVAVTAGTAHVCALTDTQAVLCWGDNTYGQTNVPAGLSSVTEIDAGDWHTCALTSAGSVVCWGADDAGQSSPPSGLAAVTHISAGGATSCAVRDVAVVCWGDDSQGQSTVPTDVNSVSQVSVGGLHVCALSTTGKVTCWGNNDDGQATAPSGLVATFIAAGDAHTCAVSTDDTVKCFGNNWYGQTAVPSSVRAPAVLAAGAAHTCTASSLGALTCWGANDYSQSQARVPDAPVITSVNAGNASASVAWTAPTFDGGSPITSYVASAAGKSCTSTGSSCVITGLMNGQAVTVVVQAVNIAGASAASAGRNITPQIPVSPPAAPTGVQALPRSGGATVLWVAPKAQSGVAITGYTVTADPGGATCSSKASLCTFSGLTNGTAYTFSVVAESNAGVGARSAAVRTVVNQFAVTASPQSVIYQGLTTITVQGAPGGAKVTIAGVVKGSLVADSDGQGTMALAVAKTGKVTGTVKVAGIVYTASTTIYIPVVKAPTSATAGKSFVIAVSAAQPGSPVRVNLSDGQELSAVAGSTGAVSLPLVTSGKGALYATVIVDDVKFPRYTITVK